MRLTVSSLFSALGLVALLGSTGCDNTPTVPVPPPEQCAVDPPDGDGRCAVRCEGGYTARDVALVYNDNWGAGVMQETEEDGSFETQIEATAGDVLLIQIKYDRRLSAEEAMTVPTE